MNFDEKKYFMRTLLKANFWGVFLFGIIVAIGIYALSSNLPDNQSSDQTKVSQQIDKTAELLCKYIEQNVSVNFEKTAYAIDENLKFGSGWRLFPDIPFDKMYYESIPSLYFGNINLSSNEKNRIHPFLQSLKSVSGNDFLIFQRISEAGDMYLVNHTFYNLPENFNLNLISPEKNRSAALLIEKIFKGQSFTILQNINDNIYSVTFRRLINRQGKILGMMGILNKLSGFIDFNISKLNYNITYYDAFTKNVLLSFGASPRKSTLAWADSLRLTGIDFQTCSYDWGRSAVCSGKLNLLILSEFPQQSKIMPSGLRANGLKLVLAVAILVMVVLVFYSVRASDYFAHKLHEKEEHLLKFLNYVALGKSREFENEIIEKSFKGEIANDEFVKSLNRINKTIYDLQQDKSDLQDFIEIKINRLLDVADKIGQLKTNAELAFDASIEHITSLTVKITQLATTANELARWETPAEISSKFDNNSAKEKVKQKAITIQTKAKLLTDKLDKLFAELNNLKKISDHTYLIAVNSSIFAEKLSSSKMELLSNEIKKISENLLNSQDQLYYLATEARNAIYACSNDLETIEIVLENTPTQSDIAKMLLEYSKFNERLASISTKFDSVVDDFRNILKNTENAKSDFAKLDGIIEDLIDISEKI